MNELTTFPPLAWDRNEERFLPESETTDFLIKRKTGGRPSLVRDEHNDPVTVAVDADLDDLEMVVDHEPGIYLLYQLNAEGEIIKGTIAQVIIGNPGVTTSDPKYEQMTHFAARLIQANEHKDALLADVTKHLVSIQATMQESAAALLSSAAETIRVANGVDKAERPAPIFDAESVAKILMEKMPAPEPQKKTLVDFLETPMAAMLGAQLIGFLKAVAAQYEAPGAPGSADKKEASNG